MLQQKSKITETPEGCLSSIFLPYIQNNGVDKHCSFEFEEEISEDSLTQRKEYSLENFNDGIPKWITDSTVPCEALSLPQISQNRYFNKLTEMKLCLKRISKSCDGLSAIDQKRIGKRRTVKRGWIRMHINEYGQETFALEGSWLFEQFILAAQIGLSRTEQLIKQLTDVMLISLKSLYMDGIKPWLGDVAHRLRPSFHHLLTLAEVRCLGEMCEEQVIIVHEMRCKGEEGSVVYLKKEPIGFQGFVDVHSIEDPFTQQEWQLFYRHMISLMQYDAVTTKDKPYEFRGGRYAFAELMQRSVLEFKNKRLGELCHMVQLAIHNGSLTYVNCVLQPSSACYSKTRATTQMIDNISETRHPVCHSIEEVIQIAALLTDNLPEGLVLAQLKQKFQREFNRDLDPEVFGYMKLQQLFVHRPLSNMYRLYTPRNSPHRTIVQHIRYPLPEEAVLFKGETAKETKLDRLLVAMSPICHDSIISFDFLNHNTVWSNQNSVNEALWEQSLRRISTEQKLFDNCILPLGHKTTETPCTYLTNGVCCHNDTDYSTNDFTCSNLMNIASIEDTDYRCSLSEEEYDARYADDAVSSDELLSVTSIATTDTSVTPTNLPGRFSPNGWKCSKANKHFSIAFQDVCINA